MMAMLMMKILKMQLCCYDTPIAQQCQGTTNLTLDSDEKTNLVACVEGNDGNVGNDDNEGNDGNDGNDGNNGNDDNDGNNGNNVQKTNLIACVEGRAEVIFKVVVNLRMCGLADWSLI